MQSAEALLVAAYLKVRRLPNDHFVGLMPDAGDFKPRLVYSSCSVGCLRVRRLLPAGSVYLVVMVAVVCP